MNNYYILKHLISELQETLHHETFQFCISPHKDVWTAYIERQDTPIRLTFSSHPSETALFIEDHRPPKKTNVTSFFSLLNGLKILDCKISENDRFITLSFENDLQLLFQLFGSKPNIFLIKQNTILESFKNPDQFTGKKPPHPRAPVIDNKIVKEGLSPKKTILLINPKFPRNMISHVSDHFEMNKKTSSEIRQIIESLTHRMEISPEFRVLYDGNICLIPKHILPLEEIKNFDDINSAVRFAYYNTSTERRFNSRIEKIKPVIQKKLDSLNHLISQLNLAKNGSERAKEYEQYGHILMANAHLVHTEENNFIQLPNYYDDNNLINIPIKPALSLAENAERYYDKSASAIRNVEESKRRLVHAEEQLVNANKLYQSLDTVKKIHQLDNWLKMHSNELIELGIHSGKRTHKSTPYRKFQLGKYEIWLGKNAKSNDRLTIDAHKEDIWMHARGASGSHLLIRMNNDKGMPPENIVLSAASIAAYHSKARGSELVPVIIAKRKYISKPKGAPPGSVKVQKERVELVKPQKSVHL